MTQHIMSLTIIVNKGTKNKQKRTKQQKKYVKRNDYECYSRKKGHVTVTVGYRR